MITKPTLREILLDAVEDAFWYQKGEVEDCRNCRTSLTGVCVDEDHQRAAERAAEYDDARKQLQQTPGHPDVLAALGGAA